ncbi:unnamed protein product [Paramecium sonneborni]|uniref:Palmitoyltransferase n=1 Tax=Paramecium sonneborni TaxID=65129 RepID=A0A8S1LWE6_9CILI|nr:unnamed protein product [Paramecium sonneborni]
MNFNQLWVLAPFSIVILIIVYLEIMLIYIFINPEGKEIIQVVLHHLLLLAVIFSFYKTSTTKPGTPKQTDTENDSLTNQRKTCKFCYNTKPIRCHHCRQCNKCILRMDHHCPWVNNCIGQDNYKYFFCLVFYATLTSVVYFTIYFNKILKNPPTGSVDTYFIIFAATLSFTLMIVLFLFLAFHTKLISNNQTTLEYFEKQREHYDKDLVSNFNEFLGPGCWLIPI